MKYREISKFPGVIKDVAFIVEKAVENAEIENVIKKAGGKLLNSIQLFDIYNMDDKKSYAYKFVFQDPTKSLTEEEVSNQFNQIIASCQKVGYSLREK